MAAFYWDSNFITDIADVDEQHMHLLDLINKLGEHLAGNDIALDYIEEIYQELADYAHYHFQCEEGLMQEAGLDQRHLDFHRKEHLDFLHEVTSMHDDISVDSPDAVSYLMEFLTHWLAYHILGADQNMARQMKAIASGLTAADAYKAEERKSDSATEPLLAALNGLFHQVSARNKQLVQLNQTLEARVAERTKALSEANLQLEALSLTDVLTGLPNRRHAMRSLAELWDEAEQSDRPLACMMIDADHFKEVNDTYGHDAGDLVLRELAHTLQQAARSGDMVSRLGGDEFFIICPDTDQHTGLSIAEAVRKKVSELHVTTGDGVWQGSVSVGLSARAAYMTDYEALIKCADLGVYEAKRAGKNCVRTVVN
ncbi:MAG: GGDEF domain-containing protein [Zetaproteobacteria bacterium CG12_big_fil_rev_8_21_14_0_65_54_13]|nr:MAG: GGDEF domain-containing protein [Zetaproteobacteria bacterium CG12_big_fil_rev_8_21_14_0_65_54_13]PIX55427.1 MAG: GGDEF domain-containing protein [Zetaproteobacteria bacterium CG_4_10_14_3_um_filter_54_28]PJA27493.1 MAG: GGDEF domain-containing protein [Zetaproteobacteria bacterium CG_4_9_14_3_um_filter_54_145]